MTATPAPTQERLGRAERLLDQAARQGAELVVLPEVFNNGYEYSDQNYRRAETRDGPTINWMRQAAASYHLHLAGSFLLWDQGDIYNSLVLMAPDGRQWRDDKNYPWYWERAYFRNGKRAAPADTDLGKIGMLVCWDVAHPRLWQSYAGRVELMIVSSCPPAAHEMTLVMPDGKRIKFGELGPFSRRIQRTSGGTFGPYLLRQAGCLNVPVVSAMGAGVFASALPRPHLSLAVLALMSPKLLKYVSQAGSLCVEAGYFNETFIADSSGQVLQRVPPGEEGFALGEVVVPDAPPSPKGPQPPFGISRFAYVLDAFANLGMIAEYRRKLRLQGS